MIITQASELLADIKAKAEKVEFLFRGHTIAGWKLMPKIARFEGRNIRNLERLIFKEFKRVSLPFLKKEPSNDLDWLTLAQHYGLPTRFLDWTYNPLAALWFAVNKNDPNEKDGAIWRLSPTLKDYQRQQNTKTENPFIIRRTMIVRPTHISERTVN